MKITKHYTKLDDVVCCQRVDNALWILVRKRCMPDDDTYYYEIGYLELSIMGFQRFSLNITKAMSIETRTYLHLIYPCEKVNVYDNEQAIIDMFNNMMYDKLHTMHHSQNECLCCC